MKKNILFWSIQLYQRLIEISRDLASTLDLDTLLRRIIQVAEEFSQAGAASILLYDESKNSFISRPLRTRVMKFSCAVLSCPPRALPVGSHSTASL